MYTLCFLFLTDMTDPTAWCQQAIAAQVISASEVCRGSKDPLSVCEVIRTDNDDGVTFWMATKWMGG
jgi:hypothetical protein